MPVKIDGISLHTAGTEPIQTRIFMVLHGNVIGSKGNIISNHLQLCMLNYLL